jgi:plasmid stabilization system protein ParE
MGSVYPRDPEGKIRVVVSGKHRIFYRVIEEAKRVEILAVWHGRRQEPDLPL